MPYVGQKPADIISTAVDTVTGTFSGDIDASTVNATGDTAAGDNAAIGFTSAEGLILTGQGSTSDITVKNDADATVFTVPTGTDDILFPDNAKILMGAGSDLTLSSDGSNGTITSNGNFTLDVVSDIILDADTRNIKLQDGGTDWGRFTRDTTTSPTAFVIDAPSNNVAIKFKGNDGGAAITALHLDMSADGHATFKNGVTLTDGNLVVASGHGINFAATGDGAGTDTSELFSDYEEGTFTPVLKDATTGNAAGSSAASGRYTKIGRVVNFSFAVSVNSLSGMTAGNSLRLTGLPYTVNNDTAGGGEPHAQILSFINNLDSADYAGSIVLRPDNNQTSCEFKYTAAGAVTSQGATSLLVQDIASNTYLTGAATYETT